MISLIRVELIKQFKKRSIKFLFVFILVVCFLNIYIGNKKYEYTSYEKFNYIDLLSQKEYTGNYKKYKILTDNYNETVSINIDKYNYYKENKIDMYSKEKYILESSITVLIFMSIIVSLLSSGILSDELNRKSIKELLTKPYKRWKILSSKYLCLFIMILSITLTIILSSFFISSIILKINWIKVIELNNKFVEYLYIFNYIKLIFLNSIPLYFISILCVFLSTILNNSKIISATIMFLSLMSTLIFQLLLKININFVEYTFLPYLDLSIYKNIFDIYQINLIYNVNLGIYKGIIVLSAHSLLFYLMSILVFNRKDIVN